MKLKKVLKYLGRSTNYGIYVDGEFIGNYGVYNNIDVSSKYENYKVDNIWAGKLMSNADGIVPKINITLKSEVD